MTRSRSNFLEIFTFTETLRGFVTHTGDSLSPSHLKLPRIVWVWLRLVRASWGLLLTSQWRMVTPAS